MKRLLLLTAVIICFTSFNASALGTQPHDPCFYEVDEGDIYSYNVKDLDTDEELTATATIGPVVDIPDGADPRPSGKIYAFTINVEYSDGTSAKFYLENNEGDFYHENLIITEDNLCVKSGTNRYLNGDMIKLLSNTPNYLVADIDYVYLGDRVRRRAKLTGESEDDEVIHIQGLGINRFVTDPEVYGHRREYRLVSISDIYGNEISGDDFHKPTVETQPTKFIDGTVVKYSMSWNEWYPPFENFKPYEECQIIGDEVVDHINVKKIKLDSNDADDWEIAFPDGMFFQYNDVVYTTFFDGFGCEIYMRFDVVPGDNVLRSLNNADPSGGRVTEISEIEILGKTMRAVRFLHADESAYLYHSYWIEGVGPNMYGLDSETENSWYGTQSLDGLYQNDECVFKYIDFYTSSSVKELPEMTAADADAAHEPIYNLQGIRISKPMPEQVYIRNGRKFINR